MRADAPKGKITFQLRYRYDGKPRRLDLGSYPLMSLKEARTEAQRLRARHEQGHDPQVVRLLEKQAIVKADSVEQLFRQWYEAYCQKNKKGHHDTNFSTLRVVADRNRAVAFLARGDPLHVGASVNDGAKRIEVIEEGRRVVYRKADFGYLAVIRADVLVAKENKVRKDAFEVIALVAASACAQPLRSDAVEQ